MIPEVKPVYCHDIANRPPVRRIHPGETLTVELPDSDGLGPDLQSLPDSLFEQGSSKLGNPVYGPIAIEGALPGDALRVHFLRIAPNRRIARTLLAPDHGFLPDALLPDTPAGKPAHMYLWDVHKGKARLTNPLGDKPVVIPTAPFLGCIATASLDHPPISSLLVSDHGGNIDHPDLTEDSALWLPVSHPGGMLYLGDMHAAQGHGELAGGGLEISGSATIQVELCKAQNLKVPRYQTPSGRASLGVGTNFETATRSAVADMTVWISEAGWNLYDANMLVNQICEIRPGGLAKEYAVVSCFIADRQLPTSSRGTTDRSDPEEK
jgi:amidase